MTNDTETSFRHFFEGTDEFVGLGLLSLEQNYEWPMPAKDFIGQPLHLRPNNFRANVKLKSRLHDAWVAKSVERISIAKWVISDWGGIRGNKPETIEEYAKRAGEADPATPLKGIASFSKVLAIKDSKKYAIYDARVAVSLNAIQLISRVRGGLAFPYLAGRNNVTGNWDHKHKRGFSTRPEYSVKSLTSPPHNWLRVEPKHAYTKYLGLLSDMCNQLNGTPIYKLEMALFSQAEVLAIKACPELRPEE